MNDLRKAAEMALEIFDWLERRSMYQDLQMKETHEALRQALDDKPPVKSYCGGRANYCTPEETPEVTGEVPCKTDPRAPHGFDRNASHSADRYVCECEGWEPPEETFILDRGCYERGCVAYDERDGDGVYMSEKRVHKTDKFVHELDLEAPLTVNGVPLYPKKEWVGLTDEEKEQATGWSVEHIEAKLKEKNGG